MTKVNFTVDPIPLTRQLLSMYSEKIIIPKNPRSIHYAISDFVRDSTDEELDQLLHEYAEKENITIITFKDWKHDCKAMLDILCERESFKKKAIAYHMQLGGETGYGVYDKKQIKFYDCHLAQHFDIVQAIVLQDYPEYAEALEWFLAYPESSDFEGTTKKSIDKFIVDTFDFVGLSNYSKNIFGMKGAKE